MTKSNYHTHSHYCDGKGELREYVDYALAHGFTHLGFSGHAPVPFENTFAIKQEEYLNYCNEVRALQQEYAGRIEIKLGLEIDYVTGVLEDFTPLMEAGNLDYCIGSVHLVTPAEVASGAEGFDSEHPQLWFIDGGKQETYDLGLNEYFHGDIREGVKAFFRQSCEMMERNRPTIVGHFDKIVMHNRNRYFEYDDPWFKSLVGETAALIRDLGLIAEINTRGIYKKRHDDFYPARQTLVEMNKMGIPVIVSTDAHQPDNLDQFEGAYEFLKEIRYKEIIWTIF